MIRARARQVTTAAVVVVLMALGAALDVRCGHGGGVRPGRR